MKQIRLFSIGLLALFLPYLSFGQSDNNCSGRFTVRYPSGAGSATVTTNNGTGNVAVTYCPSAVGTTRPIQVTPMSTSNITLTQTLANGQGVITYNAGTVPAGTTYTFNPTVSSQAATYKLDGITVGCNNPKTLDFTLVLGPAITLRAAATTVCRGSSTTLTATTPNPNSPSTNLPNTYTLTGTGVATQTSTTGIFTVTPTATTNYTVTASTAACGSIVQSIVVSVPEVNVTPAAPTITLGSSVTLTATNTVSGATYSWRNVTNNIALGTSATQVVTPSGTTVYRVTSIAATCTTTRDVTVRTIQPLPVVLSGFEAAWAAGGPTLSWTTASEVNNDYFAIERSVDGTAFTTIGRQAGAGTATSLRSYQFIDAQGAALAAPTLYYRLRQVDLNGVATYSPVRTVAVPATAGAFQAVAFPNPWVSIPTVQFTALGTTPVTLVLYDGLGRLLLSKEVAATGTQQVELPTAAGLPAGVYYLRISQGSTRQVIKLVH
jgi:hypothetical protein